MKKYNNFYISISINLNKQLKQKLRNLQKKISTKTKVNFYFKNSPDLHINIISGVVNEKNFNKLKKVNFLKINSDKKLIFNGIGSFIGKKTTIFTRYKLNNFIKEVREKIFRNYKKYFISIDNTAKDEIWIPKTTIINEIVEKKKYNNMIEILSKFKLKKLSYKSTNLVLFHIIDFKEFEIKKIKL
jgi:hypothetical protein